MAWDDDTSFDMIKSQTGLSEAEVIKIMRLELKPRSFKHWRKRVSGRSSKHERINSRNKEGISKSSFR
ncbi:TIGR03643 family protein [Kordiimonas sp. SCSIO 12610]|nr:TIGR03643 family protein [Kordiimonas sp. SCSIO 12610]